MRVIWFLIILIASVWLGLLIAKDPGLAFFSYRQWSVEMPLWFAFVSLVILMLVLYFLLKCFYGIDHLFYRWKNWLLLRRKHKSYSKTNRGLLEMLEGHWKNAEYYLSEGLPQSDAKLINYLAMAKAAHEQGAFARRDVYLRKAHAVAPNADIAIGLTQAQLQLHQGQLESALATLGHLRTVAPRHGFVLKLLERLYIHLADWKSLLKLLPDLYKSGVVDREQYAMLEKRVYEALLNSFNPEDGSDALRSLWKSIPRKLQKDHHIIFCYAKQLLSFPGNSEEVDNIVYKSLKKSWDAGNAHLYGLIDTKDAKKPLANAENLLKHYPNQAILFLTLGRLCVRCQLWGKARSYFEDSLNVEPTAETYLEYGKLLEQLGDTKDAMKCYHSGLLCKRVQ